MPVRVLQACLPANSFWGLPFAPRICSNPAQHKYIPSGVVGWILFLSTSNSVGVSSLREAGSPVNKGVGYQFVAAAGTGMISSATISQCSCPSQYPTQLLRVDFTLFCALLHRRGVEDISMGDHTDVDGTWFESGLPDEKVVNEGFTIESTFEKI